MLTLSGLAAPDSVIESPVQNQVAAAVAMTTNSEIAVFWTTESTVIRPPSTSGVVGVPVPHWDGSVAPYEDVGVWP